MGCTEFSVETIRFSRVYVKEKGKWVAVSTQNTPIAM
jgi:hypothetical protein